jgi:hypothetical protein
VPDFAIEKKTRKEGKNGIILVGYFIASVLDKIFFPTKYITISKD